MAKENMDMWGHVDVLNVFRPRFCCVIDLTTSFNTSLIMHVLPYVIPSYTIHYHTTHLLKYSHFPDNLT